MVYTADLQSSTLTKKAKEKVGHNILLKWTEHILTSIETPAILVEFQKWLDVQAHVYNKMHRKNFQQNSLCKNNFKNSGNLNNSGNHARKESTQSSGFPAQLTIRNQSTNMNSNGTVKPPSAPPLPPLNNPKPNKAFLRKMSWKPHTNNLSRFPKMQPKPAISNFEQEQ